MTVLVIIGLLMLGATIGVIVVASLSGSAYDRGFADGACSCEDRG